MQIISIEQRDENLIGSLLTVWERSVQATHLFLSPDEIAQIKTYVPQALSYVPTLIVAQQNGKPMAFMGIDKQKLEMLFVDSTHFGQGVGKALIQFAFEHHQVNEVVVNEQNPQAVGFYLHCGFEVYQRSELDEQGNPYPILFMKK